MQLKMIRCEWVSDLLEIIIDEYTGRSTQRWYTIVNSVKTTHPNSVTLLLLTVLAWQRCKIESLLKPMAAVSAALIIPNTAQ